MISTPQVQNLLLQNDSAKNLSQVQVKLYQAYRLWTAECFLRYMKRSMICSKHCPTQNCVQVAYSNTHLYVKSQCINIKSCEPNQNNCSIYQLLVASCQLLVASYKYAVVSYQSIVCSMSVASCLVTVADCYLSVASCQFRVFFRATSGSEKLEKNADVSYSMAIPSSLYSMLLAIVPICHSLWVYLIKTIIRCFDKLPIHQRMTKNGLHCHTSNTMRVCRIKVHIVR